MGTKSACKCLVLDAGPLLSLSPLRGLAERFLTVPQVLSELKDKNAREHFEKLGLLAGVKIEVREPDPASLSQVIQYAKKTGDYSALSHADLCILALTLALDRQEKEEKASKNTEQTLDRATNAGTPAALDACDATQESSTQNEPILEPQHLAKHKNCDSDDKDDVPQKNTAKQNEEEPPTSSSEEEPSEDERERGLLHVVLERVWDTSSNPSLDSSLQRENIKSKTKLGDDATLFDDPSEEDDGEGEWITPDNVEMYKSRALDLFPSADSSDLFTTVSGRKGRGGRKKQIGTSKVDPGPKEQISVGCMTADFAMQNVLLQMNLNLVGIEGKRIDKVKTWVLRCHACFKICKDPSKKFCPSCGNLSLLRTSVTAKSPTADDYSPALEVHLKKNFAYRTRGTKYSIPAPKPGSSKTGSGEGLILREDQSVYIRARKREEGRRQREEKGIVQRSLATARARGGEATGIKLGNWMDPDWVPEILSVGIGGKGRRVADGRTLLGSDGMPIIGYGRKNPNEKRRKR